MGFWAGIGPEGVQALIRHQQQAGGKEMEMEMSELDHIIVGLEADYETAKRRRLRAYAAAMEADERGGGRAYGETWETFREMEQAEQTALAQLHDALQRRAK